MLNALTHTLYRPFAALVLAASLALSPVAATPARADNQDLAAFLAALLAMGVIGATINNNRVVRPDADWSRQPQVYRTRALPEYCLQTFKTRFGKETFFEKQCLREHYYRWRSLPESCELTIRTRSRHNKRVTHNVYDPRCLHQSGYTLARRR